MEGRKDKVVLIAEDEAINKKLMERILSKAGFTVLSAGDGQSALDIYKKTHIDLILMDVQMPVMDGIETAMKIRELEKTNNRKTKIIALTAHSFADEKEFCSESGMDDIITKPIDINNMLKKINAVIPIA